MLLELIIMMYHTMFVFEEDLKAIKPEQCDG